MRVQIGMIFIYLIAVSVNVEASSLRKSNDVVENRALQDESRRWDFAHEHGTPLFCDSGSVAIGACTSGRDKNCNNGTDSHALLCSKLTPTFLNEGSQGDWIKVDISRQKRAQGHVRHAWAFCKQGTYTHQAISARCASGQDSDCSSIFGDDDSNYDHGIKCSDISEDYYLKNDVIEWVCQDHGDNGHCPDNYVAVASCASSSRSDCQWTGCSGQETYTGLKCVQYGMLKNFEWNLNDVEEITSITILQPTTINPFSGTMATANPFMGCYNGKMTSTTTRSGTFQIISSSSTTTSSTEINDKLEMTISSKYGIPRFGTSINAEEVVTTAASGSTISTTIMSGGGTTFQDVENSYNESQSFTRDINFCSTTTNDMRVVSYQLDRETIVKGTAYLSIDGEDLEEEVKVTMRTTTEDGFLPIQMSSFPNYPMKTLSDEDLVSMYLDGTLLDSKTTTTNSNPKTIASLEDFMVVGTTTSPTKMITALNQPPSTSPLITSPSLSTILRTASPSTSSSPTISNSLVSDSTTTTTSTVAVIFDRTFCIVFLFFCTLFISLLIFSCCGEKRRTTSKRRKIKVSPMNLMNLHENLSF